jgi:signal transduction histidine kinase/HPt (histidine-containing phosphotransfer) domain-containing protein/ActR/RegA family two-component response regulator
MSLGRRRLRLGLQGKLLLGVLLYIGLLAGVGGLGLYAAQASLIGFDTALQHHVREISVLSDIAETVDQVQTTALLHVLADTPEDRVQYEQRFAMLQAQVDRLVDEQITIEQSFQDESDLSRIERFRELWRDYLQARDEQVLPLSRDNRDAEALQLVEPGGAVAAAYQRVVNEVSTIEDQVEGESRNRLQESERQYAHNRDLLLGTLLVAGVCGVAFGLAQSRRLAGSVQAVSQAAHQVARGDFSPRLQVSTGDEIESLAVSFNTMTANLQRMNEERTAVERMKDQFVSTVSHELRTPMNGVIGMTDLLLAGQLGPREKRYAEGVRRSGQVLLQLVNDILDHSKIEAGKLDLESIPLDVREIVDEVVALFAETASGQGIELTAIVSDTVPPLVLGDPGRLRQVLMNLVGNAVKFTPAGVVRVSVAALGGATDVSEPMLRFEVVDTGIGIAPEARDRLFEPFTQADGSTTRTFGGTGLGLSICKRLVTLMGGDIGLESEPGRGSTFWFTLPCQASPPGESALSEPPALTAQIGLPELIFQPETASPPLPTPDGGAASPRVLLVEDSWINQQVAQGMLEQLGYRVDVVDSGRAALRTLASGARYAAVLMDCQMPGLDGYQTTAEIRRLESSLPRGTRVPIVAFTASAMAGDRERCLAAGMSDYLAKPVGLADLRRVLARWAGPADPTSPAALEVSPAAPAIRPPASQPAILDAAALDALRRLQRPGRPDLLTSVLDRFRSEVPARVADLQDALHSGDAPRLWHAAHTLKGDSGRIGARQVQRLAAEIERFGRANQLAEAAAVLPDLSQALARLDAELQACVS